MYKLADVCDIHCWLQQCQSAAAMLHLILLLLLNYRRSLIFHRVVGLEFQTWT